MDNLFLVMMEARDVTTFSTLRLPAWISLTSLTAAVIVFIFGLVKTRAKKEKPDQSVKSMLLETML